MIKKSMGWKWATWIFRKIGFKMTRVGQRAVSEDEPGLAFRQGALGANMRIPLD